RVHIRVYEPMITRRGGRIAVMLLTFEHIRLRPSERYIREVLARKGIALDHRSARLVLVEDCKIYSQSQAQRLSQAHQYLFQWDPPPPIEQILIAFAHLPRAIPVPSSSKAHPPQGSPLTLSSKSPAKRSDAERHDSGAKGATSEPPGAGSTPPP